MESNIIDLNQLTENTDQAIGFLHVYGDALQRKYEADSPLCGNDSGNGVVLMTIAMIKELQGVRVRLDAAHGDARNRSFTIEMAPHPVRQAVEDLSEKLRIAAALIHAMAGAQGANASDGLSDGFVELADWSAKRVMDGFPRALARAECAQLESEKAAREKKPPVAA